MEEERRIAPDGEAYTFQEFMDFFPPGVANDVWAQSRPVPQPAPVGLQPAPVGLQPAPVGLQPPPPLSQASEAPPCEGSAASSAPAPAMLPPPVRPGPQLVMQPPPGYVAAVQPAPVQPPAAGVAPAMRPPPGYWEKAQARLPKAIDVEGVRLNVLRCQAELEAALLTPVPGEDWGSDGAEEAEGELEAENLNAMLEKLPDNGAMRELLESAPPEIRQLLMMQVKAATSEVPNAEVEAGPPAPEEDQSEAKEGSADEARAGAGAPEPGPGGAEDGVRGDWVSDNGGCAIFDDHITNRLSYEEPVGANRLHGWLVEQEGPEDGVPAWRAQLGILEEDENPWYGPSFGEEPEYVGDIQVRMLSSDRIETRIKFMDEDGVKDSDWQPPTFWTRKPKPAPRPAVAEGTFVFGQ